MKTLTILLTLFTPLFFSISFAQEAKPVKLSLKSLAQASSFLLAQSELVLEKKSSCFKSSQEVSIASQKLKSWIDQKISQLTEDDFKILKYRIPNCEQDCSCSIYSLAFESKLGNLTEDLKKKLDEKAASLKNADHLKCAEANHLSCETALIRALK